MTKQCRTNTLLGPTPLNRYVTKQDISVPIQFATPLHITDTIRNVTAHGLTRLNCTTATLRVTAQCRHGTFHASEYRTLPILLRTSCNHAPPHQNEAVQNITLRHRGLAKRNRTIQFNYFTTMKFGGAYAPPLIILFIDGIRRRLLLG